MSTKLNVVAEILAASEILCDDVRVNVSTLLTPPRTVAEVIACAIERVSVPAPPSITSVA